MSRHVSRPGAWLANLECAAPCVEMSLIRPTSQFVAIGNGFYKHFACVVMQLPGERSVNNMGNILEYLAWVAFEAERHDWIVAVCLRAPYFSAREPGSASVTAGAVPQLDAQKDQPHSVGSHPATQLPWSVPPQWRSVRSRRIGDDSYQLDFQAQNLSCRVRSPARPSLVVVYLHGRGCGLEDRPPSVPADVCSVCPQCPKRHWRFQSHTKSSGSSAWATGELDDDLLRNVEGLTLQICRMVGTSESAAVTGYFHGWWRRVAAGHETDLQSHCPSGVG